MNGTLVRVGLLGLCVLAALVAGLAVADGIPTMTPLTYSGVLQNSAGAPVTAQQSMQLTLWDDATANGSVNQKCVTPTQNVTPDSQGRFQIVLDQACFDAVRSNRNLWVQVQVGATVLPRSKLGAVPYAVEAGRAERQLLSGPSGSQTVFGRYCGATAAVNGGVTVVGVDGGMLDGYRAVYRLCRQACTSQTAHMCTVYEANANSALGVSMPTGWINGGGVVGSPNQDCNSWGSPTAASGTIWDSNFAGSGFALPGSATCSQPWPIICCD
jgi:hypothetical protein